MKTYFIKDDETKTAEDYFRNSKFAKYLNDPSKFRLQDIISDVNGKKFKDVLTQLKQLSDDYIADRVVHVLCGPVHGFITDLISVLVATRKNGDTKITEQIIKKMNQLNWISGFTELHDAVGTAMDALVKYKNSIDKIIDEFNKI